VTSRGREILKWLLVLPCEKNDPIVQWKCGTRVRKEGEVNLEDFKERHLDWP
jgi:hypothetical protein